MGELERELMRDQASHNANQNNGWQDHNTKNFECRRGYLKSKYNSNKCPPRDLEYPTLLIKIAERPLRNMRFA